MKKLLIFVIAVLPFISFSQSKYDYNWTIGYDTSLLDPGGDVILMDFNLHLVKIQTVKTVAHH
jgi:hypothetical protein